MVLTRGHLGDNRWELGGLGSFYSLLGVSTHENVKMLPSDDKGTRAEGRVGAPPVGALGPQGPPEKGFLHLLRFNLKRNSSKQ